MQTCIAAFKSITTAIGAQRVLSAAAIRSSVVKLNANQTTLGCGYGLEFSCAQRQNVESLFASRGITANSYIGGEKHDLSG
jgi:hypothetical protein